MNHSFDINIAKEYGIEEAIMLQHLYFWIEKNRANNKHFYNETYWTYNSKKAFSDLFPYMTPRKIDYTLNNLISKGLIITGNFNSDARDRTLWYAITKMGYCILQNCEMQNTKMSNVYINNNNTNNNYTYINNTDVIDKIQQILDFWNEKEIIKHNCKNGIRDDIKAAINKALKENTIDEIKMAIERYKEVLDSEYFFNYKWNIVDFLCRKFGYKTFLDDGSNWINYLEWKKNPNPKPTYNNPTYHNPKEVVKKKLTKFEEDYFAEQEKRFYEGK